MGKLPAGLNEDQKELPRKLTPISPFQLGGLPKLCRLVHKASGQISKQSDKMFNFIADVAFMYMALLMFENCIKVMRIHATSFIGRSVHTSAKQNFSMISCY